jgi:hypothetical protein
MQAAKISVLAKKMECNEAVIRAMVELSGEFRLPGRTAGPPDGQRIHRKSPEGVKHGDVCPRACDVGCDEKKEPAK